MKIAGREGRGKSEGKM